MKRLIDSILTGIVLGILAPFAGLWVFWKSKIADAAPFSEFLNSLFTDPSYRPLMTGSLTVSLIANALVFTLFIQLEKDQSAKGVFISTVLYALAILTIKFFF
jgi:hypothetical protein